VKGREGWGREGKGGEGWGIGNWERDSPYLL
jgi:hypothetical protein